MKMHALKTFATVVAPLVPLVSSATVASSLLQGVVFEANTNASSRPIICIQGMDCFELGDPVAHEFNGSLVSNTTGTPEPVDASSGVVGAVRPVDDDEGGFKPDAVSGFVCFGTCCTRCYENGVRLFNRRRLDGLAHAGNGTRIKCAAREYGLECSPF